MDISFKRYLAFKESDLYDESYKADILSRLNEFLSGQDINEYTVLDIVKKIQKENPSAGDYCIQNEPVVRRIKPPIAGNRATVCITQSQYSTCEYLRYT